MNQPLASAFGLEDPEEAIGKADPDFISDPHQVDGFERIDQIVYNFKDPARVHIREESFSTDHGNEGSSRRITRLLTFKTQYFSPVSSSDETHEKHILGIAFDVTSVTDMLRRVARTAGDDEIVYRQSGSIQGGSRHTANDSTGFDAHEPHDSNGD